MQVELDRDIERIASTNSANSVSAGDEEERGVVFVDTEGKQRQVHFDPGDDVVASVSKALGLDGRIFFGGNPVLPGYSFEECGIDDGARLMLQIDSSWVPFEELGVLGSHAPSGTIASAEGKYELIGGNCGAWTAFREGEHEGVQVKTVRRPPHQWSKFRLDVPGVMSRATRLQTDFWIEQLDANCWYFDLHFASPDEGSELPAIHTIKFDGASLRTYGAQGVDSGTHTGIRQKTWHTLVVEIAYPTNGETVTLRHLIDGEHIFTSYIEVGHRLLSISLGKAAYTFSAAKWANVLVE